jgi:hypothetical protein
MPNPFDSLADGVWSVVERTMGYDAQWTPSNGSGTQSARVLFGEPTMEEKLGEHGDSYNPRVFFMEYWDDAFVGLFEAVREGAVEYVTVNNREFFVRHVNRKFDGRNYRARIEEITSP